MSKTVNTSTDLNLIFKNWVDQFSDTLYSRAFYKISDREKAEDLVQETFMAAYKSYNNFHQASSPKTWLLSILNHKIVDHYRKSGRDPFQNLKSELPKAENIIERTFDQNGRWNKDAEPSEWQSDSALLDQPEFNDTLDHCMNELPEEWEKAMRLKFLKEINGKDISQELGISTTNYWQIVHRAKLFLRECLEKLWFNKK